LRRPTDCQMYRRTTNARACTDTHFASKYTLPARLIVIQAGCRTSPISVPRSCPSRSSSTIIISTTFPVWKIRPARTWPNGSGMSCRQNCRCYPKSLCRKRATAVVRMKDQNDSSWRSSLGCRCCFHRARVFNELNTLEIHKILPALRSIDKVDRLNSKRGCGCQVFAHIVNKDCFSSFKLMHR